MDRLEHCLVGSSLKLWQHLFSTSQFMQHPKVTQNRHFSYVRIIEIAISSLLYMVCSCFGYQQIDYDFDFVSITLSELSPLKIG